MAGLIGRILGPFRRLSKEEQINAAIIERIRLQSEDELHKWGTRTDANWEHARVLRRLRPVMDSLGLQVADVLRWYGKRVYSIVVRPNPNLGKEELDTFRAALGRAGLVSLGDGSWVLPPARTPQNLKSGDLHSWASMTLPDDLSNRCLLELVDLRKAPPDGMPEVMARRDSMLGALHPDEILPAGQLYRYLKRKLISVEDLIRRGDVVFLASAFANQETLDKLEKHKDDATQRLLLLSGGLELSLGSLAGLPETEVAGIMEDYISHAKDFAQRLLLEVTYWLRFLEQVGRRGKP